MSSSTTSSEPRPVVVLTAGGVGRSRNAKTGTNSSMKKSNASSAAESLSSSPASRESSDSFLDQEPPQGRAPFVDEDVSMLNNTAAAATTSATGAANERAQDAPADPWATILDEKAPSSGPPSRVSSSSVPKQSTTHKSSEMLWLFICFMGIMASFVAYGLLLEYATSGGRKLHELSFLFVTSGLYTITAAAGRYVRDETPTTIPPARFAVLGLTSMGSTFFSVRSLRYVIYPVQVLAKSCKPVPVMLMGAAMGKKYSLRKYLNVCLIVLGVALFMGGKGGDSEKSESSADGASQIIGIVMLFISLCFDGGTGAYEDKLMSVHSVQPFDLMFNIQMGKTILAGIGLLVLNQIHIFIQMCNDMGFLLVALGLSGALGQVFIFVTIAKFGALTCSIIGLARKVTTLVASIWFYGHYLGPIQFLGLLISVGSMVMNFWGKKGGGGHGGHGAPPKKEPEAEETQKMLDSSPYEDKEEGVEMTGNRSDEETGAASSG